MSEPLDASRTRPLLTGGPSFSFANRIERAAWSLVWLLFARLVPPPFGWAWRKFLLRLFGARMGSLTKVYASAQIWLPRHLDMADGSTLGPGVECYNMAPVTIGKRVIVSQRAFLCGGDHDHRDPEFQLVARPIVLGDDCWVAAEAFVAPGVTLGGGAVLAARGVAVKDLPPWTVWGGNPARQLGERAHPAVSPPAGQVGQDA
ncbi:MAG: putative colanic acid biosynthesis acetyltransferase [Sphingomonadales bacterium]|nr:putative colanic acid biosynthesis acetyltransferase [Sphingomonadales bacterium]MBD3774791.1 putative colanic acid biosynthesis acetyltransferase [Paracoccaceae bacterium]